MRPLVIAVTAALLTASAACDPAARDRPAASTPAAVPASEPPIPPPPTDPVPLKKRATVRNYDTKFLLHVASVRTAARFSRAGRHERAGAGQRLVILMITATNVGKAPSRLDWNNDEPVDLGGADGKTYFPRVSFGVINHPIFPGRSLTDPYVFPVPAGTKPARAIVTTYADIGFPSVVDLTLP